MRCFRLIGRKERNSCTGRHISLALVFGVCSCPFPLTWFSPCAHSQVPQGGLHSRICIWGKFHQKICLSMAATPSYSSSAVLLGCLHESGCVISPFISYSQWGGRISAVFEFLSVMRVMWTGHKNPRSPIVQCLNWSAWVTNSLLPM